MNRFLLIGILPFCFYACTSDDPHPELMKFNKGSLYDSLEYLVDPGTEGCVEDCDTTSHIGFYLLHRCKCSKWGYCPYYRLPYKDMSLSEIIAIKGEPTYQYIDTAYYGYKIDSHNGHIFCISDFFEPSTTNVEECQEFYRVSKILCQPINTVCSAKWIDKESYLRMHFLVTDNDTLAFHGFQSLPEYEQFWQY